jgi:beta-glucosidase-like glycosyl hydrolase/CubicO group peptidase (beta-lactamase class C family)
MAIAYHPKFYNQNNPEFKQLENRIKSYHVGGVTFLRGNPYAVVRCIERFQEAAEIPLLVMAGMEWGITMRVNEGTSFMENMAVGATRSEDCAYEIGKICAKEAKALGIHIAYSPVLDVNNNPDNIIVNTRSYGEDPHLVARLGTAFIRGLQENGIYATAKHYPGHGDTNVDSHIELPSINASRERIQNVELVPFKAAINAGLKCIMVAHVTYEAFTQMEARPASLDPYFVQDVLRNEMGFTGLVITDAMGMGGIINNYWSGEAAVMAINAGVDIILMTPNFETTFDFLVNAVKDERISEKRIDESVRRILQVKQHFGLDKKKPVTNLALLEEVMASPEHLQKAVEIANASMTLLRDDKDVFPLHAEKLDSVLVVIVTDRESGYLYEKNVRDEVSKRVPTVQSVLLDSRTTQEEFQQVIARTDSAKAVIVGMFVRWGSYRGSISLPDTTAKLLNQLFRKDKPMAVIAFGSPYLLRQIPEAPSYLCAYQTNTLAVSAAIRAVFGEIPLTAKLPVSIPGYYKFGDGLERQMSKMEIVTNISDDILKEAYTVLKEAIADSVFPGAEIAVVHDGKLIANRGFGRQTYDPDSPAITPGTIYDLASVTKVAATTIVAMQLWENGKIKLDIPAKSYLPKFTGGAKDSVTIRNLLTHSGGAHWWVDLWDKAQNKEEALDYIYQLPLDYTPGDSMIYSDLGLIMTGQILETVTGKPIDQLAADMIYKPMGVNNTMFNPPKDLLPRIAPTEIGGSMNRGLIHGDVHDENAFFFNGVSTHAGLFSTAEDLAALAQMLLNGGIYRHHRFFSPHTIKYWTSRQNIPEGSARAVGWDTPSDHGSSAGDYFSKGSFGHLGFTGTSIWIDPNRKIAIILLSNRVYPTRERGGMYEVRRNFYKEAMKALLESMGEEIPGETAETTK